MTKNFAKILVIQAFLGLTTCGSYETPSSSPAPQRDPKVLTLPKDSDPSDAPSDHEDEPEVPTQADHLPENESRDLSVQPPSSQEDQENAVSSRGLPLRDTSLPGPYRAASYSEGLGDAGYASAIVYYPAASTSGLLPATTLVAGYTNTKEQIIWMADHLATHGFVVIAFTPTSNFSLNATDWSLGHIAAFQKLKSENQRSGSPLFGRIDPERLGLMGFSMGGAGSIIAANGMPEARTTVAFCAYQPVTPSGNNAILLITGTADAVSQPQAIESAYSQMISTKPRALLSFRDLAHGDILRSPSFRDPLAYYFTAFLLSNLAGFYAYQAIFTDSEAQAERDRLFAIFDFKP